MDVSIVSTYLNCALLDLAMVLVQTKSHCILRGVAFSLTPNSALVLGQSVYLLACTCTWFWVLIQLACLILLIHLLTNTLPHTTHMRAQTKKLSELVAAYTRETLKVTAPHLSERLKVSE